MILKLEMSNWNEYFCNRINCLKDKGLKAAASDNPNFRFSSGKGQNIRTDKKVNGFGSDIIYYQLKQSHLREKIFVYSTFSRGQFLQHSNSKLGSGADLTMGRWRFGKSAAWQLATKLVHLEQRIPYRWSIFIKLFAWPSLAVNAKPLIRHPALIIVQYETQPDVHSQWPGYIGNTSSNSGTEVKQHGSRTVLVKSWCCWNGFGLCCWCWCWVSSWGPRICGRMSY